MQTLYRQDSHTDTYYISYMTQYTIHTHSVLTIAHINTLYKYMHYTHIHMLYQLYSTHIHILYIIHICILHKLYNTHSIHTHKHYIKSRPDTSRG